MRCTKQLPSPYDSTKTRTCGRSALRDGSGLCVHHHPNYRLARLLSRLTDLKAQVAATQLEIDQLPALPRP